MYGDVGTSPIHAFRESFERSGLDATQSNAYGVASLVFWALVVVMWFVVLGALGLRQIVAHPGVLRAVSPTYAVEFFVAEPWKAFVPLGSIFLVVTGGEGSARSLGDSVMAGR